jgi:hypothetical protein
MTIEHPEVSIIPTTAGSSNKHISKMPFDDENTHGEEPCEPLRKRQFEFADLKIQITWGDDRKTQEKCLWISIMFLNPPTQQHWGVSGWSGDRGITIGGYKAISVWSYAHTGQDELEAWLKEWLTRQVLLAQMQKGDSADDTPADSVRPLRALQLDDQTKASLAEILSDDTLDLTASDQIGQPSLGSGHDSSATR